MSNERVRRLREAAQEEEDQAIRAAEEGELRHLSGKPLDLSDDSPTWFLNKMLKREGFSHPLLERGKDVDRLQAEVDRIVRSLREARARLTAPGISPTVEQVRGFNVSREHALSEYRQALQDLNHAITFYNIGMPESLHRPTVLIADAVARADDEIPPIPEPSVPPRETFRQRLARRLRGTRGQ